MVLLLIFMNIRPETQPLECLEVLGTTRMNPDPAVQQSESQVSLPETGEYIIQEFRVTKNVLRRNGGDFNVQGGSL